MRPFTREEIEAVVIYLGRGMTYKEIAENMSRLFMCKFSVHMIHRMIKGLRRKNVRVGKRIKSGNQ